MNDRITLPVAWTESKAATATAERVIEGLASTWDLDDGGDKIEPGAFRNTLTDWRATGEPLPLLDSHSTDSLRRIVGRMIDAEETEAGLWASFELVDSRDGEEALARVRGGHLNGLSIGYRVIRHRPPSKGERSQGVRRVLQELALLEVSLVAFPMNRNARVLKRLQEARGPLWNGDLDGMELPDRIHAVKMRAADMEISRALRNRPEPWTALDEEREALLHRLDAVLGRLRGTR